MNLRRIIKGVKKQDSITERAFYDKFKDSLFAKFRSLGLQVEETEDFTQDVLVRVVQAIRKGKFKYQSEAGVWGYIFRAAENHFYERKRTEKSKTIIQSLDSEESYVEPTSDTNIENEVLSLIDQAPRKIFLACLKLLSPHHRVVYLMYTTHHEVVYVVLLQSLSEYLGCSLGDTVDEQNKTVAIIADLVFEISIDKTSGIFRLSESKLLTIRNKYRDLITRLRDLEKAKIQYQGTTDKCCRMKDVSRILNLENAKSLFDHAKPRMEKCMRTKAKQFNIID